jgi:hypothetical protein
MEQLGQVALSANSLGKPNAEFLVFFHEWRKTTWSNPTILTYWPTHHTLVLAEATGKLPKWEKIVKSHKFLIARFSHI